MTAYTPPKHQRGRKRRGSCQCEVFRFMGLELEDWRCLSVCLHLHICGTKLKLRFTLVAYKVMGTIRRWSDSMSISAKGPGDCRSQIFFCRDIHINVGSSACFTLRASANICNIDWHLVVPVHHSHFRAGTDTFIFVPMVTLSLHIEVPVPTVGCPTGI